MALEIPLQPRLPHYTFFCEVNGSEYLFEVRWNAPMRAWFLDVRSAAGDVLCSNAQLRPGWFIGARFRDSRLAPLGLLQLVDTEGKGDLPTFESLGVRHKLLAVAASELRDALPTAVARGGANEDWGLITESVYNTEDWGSIVAPLDSSDDFGDI